MRDDAIPLIKSFNLVGLHGYKSIRLDFQSRAKIVIAENGAGKTIFLSALDAFLSRNFDKLANIQFERIECELNGLSSPLILHRNQLQSIPDDHRTTLRELAHYARTDIRNLRDQILHHDGSDIRETPTFNLIYVNSPWSHEDTTTRIRLLNSVLKEAQSDEIKLLTSSLKTALGSAEVLFLPTYRRIELSISKRENRRIAGQSIRARTILAADEPFDDEQSTLGINYGLADVEARLRRLTESIQTRSNFGYREISAAIIDDLLAGRFASGNWQSETLPKIDSLRLFFSRIQKSPNDSDQRLEAIDNLYKTGQIEEGANGPLRYFLSRLSTVVNQTKEIESNIENFVQISNEYLSRSSDEKLLRYDATQMKVNVVNVWTDSKIRFDDLSSGEKQVISLFAHLYLSQKKKIVLIDEPELSLSIEWQKRLLPDVVGAPTCLQLLAITHSPFVFENELDPCASPLDVTRIKKKMVES